MTQQMLALMFTLEAMTVEVALDFLFFAESGFPSAARSTDFGSRRAIQFVADGDVGQSLSSHSDVLFGQLAFHKLPIQLLRDGQSCRTSGEWVQDHFTIVRTGSNDASQKLFGHLTAVDPGTLFERSGTRGKHQVSSSALDLWFAVRLL